MITHLPSISPTNKPSIASTELHFNFAVVNNHLTPRPTEHKKCLTGKKNLEKQNLKTPQFRDRNVHFLKKLFSGILNLRAFETRPYLRNYPCTKKRGARFFFNK